MTVVNRSVAAIERLQSAIDNPLGPSVLERQWLAGIIGDRPSRYAKSPSLWNAAFRALGVDAEFFPFDVAEHKLPHVVAALRAADTVLGFCVTVPYKVEIIPLLDHVEETAAAIGAVNAVARTEDGRLIGYNTDAAGALFSLVHAVPGQSEPFLRSLEGLDVLLFGAGGAARAVAFTVAAAVGPRGSLAIVNRSGQRAGELAAAVAARHGNTRPIVAADLPEAIGRAGLVINATVAGQAGLRALPGGRATWLEPYSPLGPAAPAEIDRAAFTDDRAAMAAIYKSSLDDRLRNTFESEHLLAALRPNAKCFDLIYAPLETVFLRQARWAGLEGLNGKSMNIAQAVDAFVNRVVAPRLGLGQDQVPIVFQTMAAVW